MDYFRLLKNNRTFSLRTEGESMSPLLHSGDIVHFRRVAFSDIKINDIVLVKQRGWFVHRVVYMGDGFVLTQGDNNQYADTIVKPPEVLARADKISRKRDSYNLGEVYAIQSSLYQEEILRLHRAFSRKEIKYVFLKGLPLHRYYFKSVPQRLLADCDLLVRAEDAPLVDRVFAELGYEKETEYLLSFLSYKRRHSTELGFVKYKNGYPVVFDVHYEITPKTTHFPSLHERLRPVADRMLSSKRSVAFGGNRLPVLGENDLVLFLLIHLVNHMWGGFFRFEFLKKVVEEGHINWQTVFARAKDAGLINYIFPSLYHLNTFYGIARPLQTYRKIYPGNYLYTAFLLRLVFKGHTVLTYQQFRYWMPVKWHKFVLRFLLYDRSFITKTAELLRQDFLGYAVYYWYRRYNTAIKPNRRSRGNSGIGRRKVGPQGLTRQAS